MFKLALSLAPAGFSRRVQSNSAKNNPYSPQYNHGLWAFR